MKVVQVDKYATAVLENVFWPAGRVFTLDTWPSNHIS